MFIINALVPDVDISTDSANAFVRLQSEKEFVERF
jgi:hypothetical protein